MADDDGELVVKMMVEPSTAGKNRVDWPFGALIMAQQHGKWLNIHGELMVKWIVDYDLMVN